MRHALAPPPLAQLGWQPPGPSSAADHAAPPAAAAAVAVATAARHSPGHQSGPPSVAAPPGLPQAAATGALRATRPGTGSPPDAHSGQPSLPRAAGAGPVAASAAHGKLGAGSGSSREPELAIHHQAAAPQAAALVRADSDPAPSMPLPPRLFARSASAAASLSAAGAVEAEGTSNGTAAGQRKLVPLAAMAASGHESLESPSGKALPPQAGVPLLRSRRAAAFFRSHSGSLESTAPAEPMDIDSDETSSPYTPMVSTSVGWPPSASAGEVVAASSPAQDHASIQPLPPPPGYWGGGGTTRATGSPPSARKMAKARRRFPVPKQGAAVGSTVTAAAPPNYGRSASMPSLPATAPAAPAADTAPGPVGPPRKLPPHLFVAEPAVPAQDDKDLPSPRPDAATSTPSQLSFLGRASKLQGLYSLSHSDALAEPPPSRSTTSLPPPRAAAAQSTMATPFATPPGPRSSRSSQQSDPLPPSIFGTLLSQQRPETTKSTSARVVAPVAVVASPTPATTAGAMPSRRQGLISIKSLREQRNQGLAQAAPGSVAELVSAVEAIAEAVSERASSRGGSQSASSATSPASSTDLRAVHSHRRPASLASAVGATAGGSDSKGITQGLANEFSALLVAAKATSEERALHDAALAAVGPFVFGGNHNNSTNPPPLGSTERPSEKPSAALPPLPLLGSRPNWRTGNQGSALERAAVLGLNIPEFHVPSNDGTSRASSASASPSPAAARPPQPTVPSQGPALGGPSAPAPFPLAAPTSPSSSPSAPSPQAPLMSGAFDPGCSPQSATRSRRHVAKKVRSVHKQPQAEDLQAAGLASVTSGLEEAIAALAVSVGSSSPTADARPVPSLPGHGVTEAQGLSAAPKSSPKATRGLGLSAAGHRKVVPKAATGSPKLRSARAVMGPSKLRSPRLKGKVMWASVRQRQVAPEVEVKTRQQVAEESRAEHAAKAKANDNVADAASMPGADDDTYADDGADAEDKGTRKTPGQAGSAQRATFDSLHKLRDDYSSDSTSTGPASPRAAATGDGGGNGDGAEAGLTVETPSSPWVYELGARMTKLAVGKVATVGTGMGAEETRFSEEGEVATWPNKGESVEPRTTGLEGILEDLALKEPAEVPTATADALQQAMGKLGMQAPVETPPVAKNAVPVSSNSGSKSTSKYLPTRSRASAKSQSLDMSQAEGIQPSRFSSIAAAAAGVQAQRMSQLPSARTPSDAASFRMDSDGGPDYSDSAAGVTKPQPRSENFWPSWPLPADERSSARTLHVKSRGGLDTAASDDGVLPEVVTAPSAFPAASPGSSVPQAYASPAGQPMQVPRVSPLEVQQQAAEDHVSVMTSSQVTSPTTGTSSPSAASEALRSPQLEPVFFMFGATKGESSPSSPSPRSTLRAAARHRQTRSQSSSQHRVLSKGAGLHNPLSSQQQGGYADADEAGAGATIDNHVAAEGSPTGSESGRPQHRLPEWSKPCTAAGATVGSSGGVGSSDHQEEDADEGWEAREQQKVELSLRMRMDGHKHAVNAGLSQQHEARSSTKQQVPAEAETLAGGSTSFAATGGVFQFRAGAQGTEAAVTAAPAAEQPAAAATSGQLPASPRDAPPVGRAQRHFQRRVRREDVESPRSVQGASTSAAGADGAARTRHSRARSEGDVLLGGGVASSEETCDKWRLRGNQAYANGDFQKAEEHYTRGVACVPRGTPSQAAMLCYSNRAATRMGIGRLRDALSDCSEAMAIDPQFVRVRLRAASCHLTLGNFEEAEANFQYCLVKSTPGGKAAVEAEDGLQKTEVGSGHASTNSDCMEIASSRHVRFALEIARTHVQWPTVPVVMQKARSLGQEAERLLATSHTKDTSEALRLLNEALVISEHSEAFLRHKGEALMTLRLYEDVVKLCESTLPAAESNSPCPASQPTAVDVWSWQLKLIAQARHAQGNLEDAIVALEGVNKATSLTNSSGDAEMVAEWISCMQAQLQYKAKGNAAFQAGKHAEAIEHYTAALNISTSPASNSTNSTRSLGESKPFAAVCFANRAAASQALGQIADAISDCSRAIALDPKYAKAISRRATLYEKVRDFGQAGHDLQMLLGLHEGSVDNHRTGTSGHIHRKAVDAAEVWEAKERLRRVEEEGKQNISVDYYLILGIEPSSSSVEIKKAYHRAALRHHPDKAGQSLASEDTERLFKLIGEAYNVLSDPIKKEKYDAAEYRSSPRSKVFSGANPYEFSTKAGRGGRRNRERWTQNQWNTYADYEPESWEEETDSYFDVHHRHTTWSYDNPSQWSKHSEHWTNFK
eukprot:SM000024S07750  [mRNA]  locus=s24:185857:194677:- [translate_table: standard]